MTCVIIGGEDNAVSDSTAAHAGHEDLSSSNTDGCIITALKGDRAFSFPPQTLERTAYAYNSTQTISVFNEDQAGTLFCACVRQSSVRCCCFYLGFVYFVIRVIP